MNLLQETKAVLRENGKSLKDIKWVGCDAFTIPLENFVACADKEYDNGFGAQEVATDIVVVGNNWWLERHEYDGCEWWEYKELPHKPSKGKHVERVIGDMWVSLEEMNKGGDTEWFGHGY